MPSIAKPTVGSSGWDDEVDAVIDFVNTSPVEDLDDLATDAEVAAAISAHSADTTSVHGIADTSVLATDSDVSGAVSTHAAATDPHADRAYADSAIGTHSADTTSVHGIADTSALVTTSSAPELIRDTIGTALVEGSGIDITVDDGADTITIAATGGGGGADLSVLRPDYSNTYLYPLSGLSSSTGTGTNNALRLSPWVNHRELAITRLGGHWRGQRRIDDADRGIRRQRVRIPRRADRRLRLDSRGQSRRDAERLGPGRGHPAGRGAVAGYRRAERRVVGARVADPGGRAGRGHSDPTGIHRPDGRRRGLSAHRRAQHGPARPVLCGRDDIDHAAPPRVLQGRGLTLLYVRITVDV
jgi:hypothetical protein